MAKNFHGGRYLLNNVGYESVGAIVAEIEDTGQWKKGHDGHGNKLDPTWVPNPLMNLAISDCSRSIHLAVDLHDEGGYDNTLAKVDRMVEVLTGFREGLVVERERYIKRKRAADRALKKLPKERIDD